MGKTTLQKPKLKLYFIEGDSKGILWTMTRTPYILHNKNITENFAIIPNHAKMHFWCKKLYILSPKPSSSKTQTH